MITLEDERFMKIALRDAEEGARRGDFPVGAALVINGKLIGSANNSNYTNEAWNNHAESSLINLFAHAIQIHKKREGEIELYTTLEPCLMCLGACVLNRVDRIVYACPDPNAGAARLDPKNLAGWYQRHWPIIESGIFSEEAHKILVDYMREQESWKKPLVHFEKMHQIW